ncbi:MAG: STAS domain-containing protein [Elusimicrobiota bacterium]
MEIGNQIKDGIMILAVKGDIELNTAPQLQEEFQSLKDNNITKVVVNLSQVNYIDSSGLGTFIGALKMFNAVNGKIVLAGLSSNLKKIFEITRMSNFFSIYETDTQALEKLK